MPDDLIASIAKGLTAGRYAVLLGAGASASAVSRDGRALPTATPLRDELVQAFELPSGAETASLPSVFRSAGSAHPEELIKYLADRFLGTNPVDWHLRLVRLPWSRIWTLNVDDVIETACERAGVPFAPIFVTHDPGISVEREATEVVHIHGAVEDVIAARGRGEPPETALQRLVFDSRSYGRRASAPPTWHQRFEDDVAGLPFVILGARLADEVDFWRLIERAAGVPRDEEHPSVVVLRSVNDFDRDRLRNEFGFEVLALDAEEFTARLERLYQEALASSAETLGGPVGPQAIAFLQQFIDLRRAPQQVDAQRDRTRFYQGWAPTWPVIRTLAADAELETVETLSRTVRERLKVVDTEPTLFLLTGGPGSGKSTALYRIASDVLDAGYSPWFFRADERLEPESAVEWSSKHHTALLVIDDLADFASDVGDAMELARRNGTRLVVISAIRDQRRDYAIDRLDDAVVPDEVGVGLLTADDVRSLVSKLGAAGMLGGLTRRRWEDQRRFFMLQHRGQLFNALAELTEGDGFTARIRSTFDGLDERSRAVLTPIALSYNFGLHIRPTFVARAARLSPAEVVDTINENLRGLVVVEDAGCRLNHRVVASMILQEALTPEQRFRSAVELCKALAPHVDRRQLANLSRAFRITRELLAARNVRWLCGPEHAEEFYASLEASFGWNGRFWDQRAIWHLEQGELPLARTYAEKSVYQHRHPYALTLLGQTLFAMARQSGDGAVLVDAERSLRQARDEFTHWRYWAEDAKPFEIFFDGLVSFRGDWGESALPREVTKRWPEWVDRAKASRISSVLRQLGTWQERWEEGTAR